MDNIRKSIDKMFSDSGEVSIRRVVGMLAFLMIAFCTLVDVFMKATVTEFIFHGLMWIVLGCFGLTTITGFKTKDESNDTGE